MHYEGIHRIDADTGERGEVVEEMQEAVVQCMDCMHDQPHLAFHHERIEPVEDRWERMIAGAPWVASCTVTVDADDVETCSGPDARDALTDASFGEHGTRPHPPLAEQRLQRHLQRLDELAVPVYRRSVLGHDRVWCPQWWRHAEAVARPGIAERRARADASARAAGTARMSPPPV
jgi:hypothetical protein